jgi:hypothetical protein
MVLPVVAAHERLFATSLAYTEWITRRRSLKPCADHSAIASASLRAATTFVDIVFQDALSIFHAPWLFVLAYIQIYVHFADSTLIF